MRANASRPSSDSHGSAATVPMPVAKALSAVRRLTPAGFNSWAFCMAHHAADAGARSRTSGASAKREDAVGADVSKPLALAVRPLHHNRGHGRGRAEAEVRPNVARRQVTAVGAHPPPECGTPGSLTTHPAADPEPVARPLVESHLQPVLLPA